MSKSYGNAILLKDSPEVIRQKISTMMTDVRRKRRTDPGVPEDCPVFTLHKAFVATKQREELAQGCRTAGIGCLECKNVVIESLLNLLTPYREKRDKFEKKPQLVWEILEEGNDKARLVAQKTMEEVRSAIGL
jgi:tryptophanyl-tRNA synthetase